jgi:signal transduction histidine kinase/CheY-like chemotaxis protein/CHASE3 domain sensor protein
MQKKSPKIIKNILIVFIFSTLLLLVSIISSIFCINELIDSSKWVTHTYEVLGEAENLLSSIKDAESGQRGYIITKNDDFLDPFNQSYASAKKALANIAFLTQDNHIQQVRSAEALPILEERFRQMNHVIFLRKQKDFDEKIITQELVEGKKIMEKLRRNIHAMKREETKLLAIRNARLEIYTQSAPIIIILAALLSIGITLVSFIRIKRETEDRLEKQLEDEHKYQETSERISQMEILTKKISEGDLSLRSEDAKTDEIGRIAGAINNMSASLQKSFTDLENKNWLESNAAIISDAVRGQTDIALLTASVLKTTHNILNFQVATFYTLKNHHSDTFTLNAQQACVNPPPQLKPGETLTGEALKHTHTTVINEIPLAHLKITSSIAESHTGYLLLVPFHYNNDALGILELGLLKKPTELELQLVENSKEAIAISINAALSFRKLQDLLEETQAQSEELQAQHNELEGMNVELETQTQKLQTSEEELRVQQEELLQANTELEERSGLLQEKNTEIQTKVQELALTTKYKSEFLANMSHELRTPLNSILLLSRLLSDNNHKRLNSEEVEYAKVIQSSGNGLLNLINEILDLTKIETGKMDLELEDVKIKEVLDGLRALFYEVAREKNIDFKLFSTGEIPVSLETDKMRLEQILKNLISNALKFTSKGAVSVEVKICPKNSNCLCFIVKDTGIGVPKDRQALIFEAFQQADGSTKRKYGGTGLGLSISKQLVKLLQGEITLISEVDEGSEFTVYIPIKRTDQNLDIPSENQLTPGEKEDEKTGEQYLSLHIPDAIKDDRDNVKQDENCILIVEDDIIFAKSLLEFTRKKGYKGIVIVRGDEAVDTAKKYLPKGILLDIELPVKSGWEVMDDLKKDSATRHIPVHIMSSHQVKRESLLKGAVDFIEKPFAFEQMQEIFKKIEYILTKNPKKVLIVEDNTMHAKALAYYLETHQIHSEIKSDIQASMDALKTKDVDCVILDMGIPANNAYEVLEEFKKDATFESMPIIIFTGKSLSQAEEQRIKKYADAIVVKTAYSYQRMLDEVSLFLHVVEENKSKKADHSFKKLGTLDQVLKGKTVLITDDDVRNIFSLTKALETLNLNVLTATNGKEALQKLSENPSIDIVLLDMMMPEMDGYETARHIRENAKWKKLPVIAVTAKAMTGDREKCINAGASDYISKPVDIDQLLSLLRVWLYDSSK